MRKPNGKESMMIFCHRCGYEAEYSKSPPLKCPKCKWHKLSSEKDPAWNPLCEMWATANGYSPSPRSSLPQWFFQMDKIVAWKKFKTTIENHEAIGPPPVSGNSNQGAELWKVKTGLKPLLVKAIEAIYSGLGISGEDGAEEFLNRDVKIKGLMDDYLNHWKRKMK